MKNRILLASFCCMLLALCVVLQAGQRKSRGDSMREQIAGHRISRIHLSADAKVVFSGPDLIFEDEAGLYWVGDPSGLSKYDEKLARWTLELPHGIDLIGQAGNRLWFCDSSSQKGRIWCFDKERWQHDSACGAPRIKGRVTGMFTGQSNKMWIVSDKDELLVNDGQQWGPSIEIPRLKIGYVKVVFQDSQGFIWLGAPEGIWHFDPRNRIWKHYYYPKEFGPADTIHEDRSGRLWMTGAGEVVAFLEKPMMSWTSHNLLDHLPQSAKTIDRAGELLGGKFIFLVGPVYQDKTKKIMIGTNRGLMVFDEEKHRWELFTSKNSDLPSDNVTTIMEDLRERIWIGTTKGIVVLE